MQIDEGERVCLVGRNGAGKTTLMRVLAGEESASEGDLIQRPGTVITRLPQEIPEGIEGIVLDVILSGMSPDRQEEAWETDRRIELLAGQMGLPAHDEFGSLSGGMQRRVLLARALAGEPDVLLLDEPTNHLDIESIVWLERTLVSRRPTLFFVTHDRAFLRRIATRIVELDRGRLASWDCDYDTYLVRRTADLHAEARQWEKLDKKLAQEEAWLRQGVKARRTRNEGRVRELLKLRKERASRREQEGKARLSMQDARLSGQKVIEAKEISFSYDNEIVIDQFSTTIWRGDKIGIIGPNGAGKSTLLKLLLGELEPSEGEIRRGSNIEVVYLDQLRDAIDDGKTVAQNVAGDAETVTFQGRALHIHSYLRDFLFRSDRIRQPAGLLSGGERNRLLLARLFLQPANLLVLDEPTNDLDAETLELLEELLIGYAGTLLLVSHDRAFLDAVVTATFVFEGEAGITESVGGYADWLERKSAPAGEIPAANCETPDREKKAGSQRPAKFLNRDRRELEALPGEIERLEGEHAAVAKIIADPDTYRKTPEILPDLEGQLDSLAAEIATRYARWEELESLRIEIEGRASG